MARDLVADRRRAVQRAALLHSWLGSGGCRVASTGLRGRLRVRALTLLYLSIDASVLRRRECRSPRHGGARSAACVSGALLASVGPSGRAAKTAGAAPDGLAITDSVVRPILETK